MNTKRLFEKLFGLTLDIQDVIPVEIWHLISYSSMAVPLARETKASWEKYRLEIERPQTGDKTINLRCQICDAPLKITVFSKKYLVKVMKIVGAISSAFVALCILFVAIASLAKEKSLIDFGIIGGIVSAVLAILGMAILVPIFHFLYYKKGISDSICDPSNVGGKMINKHIIEQSPKS